MTHNFSDMEIFLYEAIDIQFKVYLPLTCFIGLTGNAMVWILIQNHRTLKRFPSNVYLLAMATCSSVFLGSLLLTWTESVAEWTIHGGSNWGCKSITFLAHTCDFAGVWLIVFVCFERFSLMKWPRRATSIEKARIHVLCLLLFACVYNSWILLVATSNEELKACDINKEYEILYDVFNTIEMVLCMLLPALLISVLNMGCIKLLRAYMRYQPMRPNVTFKQQRTSLDSATLTMSTLNPSTTRQSCEITQQEHRTHRIRSAELQLTKTLLVVTTSFILLNLPNYIFRFAYAFFWNPSSERDVKFNAIRLVVYTLYYTHHACLFYLYIFYSPQMKKQLLPTATKLLECYCLKTVPDISD